jgi:hypothetical protein
MTTATIKYWIYRNDDWDFDFLDVKYSEGISEQDVFAAASPSLPRRAAKLELIDIKKA